MTVASGEAPYSYIDLPFLCKGRGQGSVGVPWQNVITPIPEPSGYLFEQAMFVQLAEMNKYGDQRYAGHCWWIYKGANLSQIIKEPISDPNPSGSAVMASGNMNCLNMVQDLRDSLNRIFVAISTDSIYTSGQIREDYFRSNFPTLPSGRAGDYQFRIIQKPFNFGPINDESGSGQYVGASGYLDSQTILEVSYQPYSRFSDNSSRVVRGFKVEVAPLFPACIGSDGKFLTSVSDDSHFYAGDYDTLGLPQSKSSFNSDALPSGYMRICGDAFSKNTSLQIVTSNNELMPVVAVDKRWLGNYQTRNLSESENLVETNGMAYVRSSAQSLPHGVQKVILSTSDIAYGASSGILGVYPDDAHYHVTGWVSGLVGQKDDNDIIRNCTGGSPADGVTVLPSENGTVNRSSGIHVCDKVFGGHNTSGVVVISPFNGIGLFLNAYDEKNFGSDGEMCNATLITIPSNYPYYHYTWYQYWNDKVLRWRDINYSFVRAEGSDIAYAYMSTQIKARRNYTYGEHAPDIWIERGPPRTSLVQCKYHFLTFNTSTHKQGYCSTNYRNPNGSSWSSAGSNTSIWGLAWSRNYGWFVTGGPSTAYHIFPAGLITGTPDGGLFVKAGSDNLSIYYPIGIGSLSFVRTSLDEFTYRTLSFNPTVGGGRIAKIGAAYTVVATNGVPFKSEDMSLPFRGHTIFVGSNDEGITPGDWVVVSTTKGTYICRAVVTGRQIQLVECLFNVPGSYPEFLMSL